MISFNDYQYICNIHSFSNFVKNLCYQHCRWVAYDKERYKGRQYLLEEGEYEHWQSWGGISSVLLSVRFLQAVST